ncbi:MAG TPA: hypothetical protein VGP38_11245 [Rubrobacter sp.]|nr:hypothetical protein [Rubrobacter sp.]
MDELERQDRTLDALESIAADLERLLLLREYELGVRVVNDEGSLLVKPAEK